MFFIILKGVLNLMGNEAIRHISNYRKNFICGIVSLDNKHIQ